MTDILFTGEYAYSSWSLRGWLLFDAFGLPCTRHLVEFGNRDVGQQMARLAPPAQTVPAARFDDGSVVWDSLALVEELATRHPGAGHWPEDPKLRATARSLTAEMHASFTTLRGTCPMSLRQAYVDVPVDEALGADLARLETIWAFALEQSGGPWLCGAYCAADAFYAPVAARIAGYGLPVSDRARAYVNRHLADPAFRRWRAMGFALSNVLPWYDQPYATTAWPGPTPRSARATETGPATNKTCPYSGKPVGHFLEMDGKTYGFCNAFCRDKTAADPEVWPGFMALVS